MQLTMAGDRWELVRRSYNSGGGDARAIATKEGPEAASSPQKSLPGSCRGMENALWKNHSNQDCAHCHSAWGAAR